MSEADRERWDAKYRDRSSRSPGAPAVWLEQSLHDLPRGGRVLDLAAGDGANALLLASRGCRVTAVDISPIGLDIGRKVAGPLPIEWVVADLDDYQPAENVYDAVLCFRFLDRARLPTMVDRALKPGGVFLAETFHVTAEEDRQERPKNPEYLLKAGEWREMFSTWEVIKERTTHGLSAIVLRKPVGKE